MTFLATVLQSHRVNYAQTGLDTQNHRVKEQGAVEVAKKQTSSLIPANEIERVKTSQTRLTEITVIPKLDPTLVTARSCNPAGVQAGSQLVPLTWNTTGFDVAVTPATYVNNELAMENDMNRQLMDGTEKMISDIGADIVAALEANKTQNLSSPYPQMPFDPTFELQTAQAEKDRIFNRLKDIMRENKFRGTYDVLSSFGLGAEIDYYRNQGGGNANNTEFQFGGYNFYYDDNVTRPAGSQAISYVLADASIGIVFWVDIDSRQGGTAGKQSDNGRWYTASNMPMLGHDMGVYETVQCQDQSGTYGAGYEATEVRNMRFTVDYSVVTTWTPNLVTDTTGIVKHNLLTT